MVQFHENVLQNVDININQAITLNSFLLLHSDPVNNLGLRIGMGGKRV